MHHTTSDPEIASNLHFVSQIGKAQKTGVAEGGGGYPTRSLTLAHSLAPRPEKRELFQ